MSRENPSHGEEIFERRMVHRVWSAVYMADSPAYTRQRLYQVRRQDSGPVTERQTVRRVTADGPAYTPDDSHREA